MKKTNIQLFSLTILSLSITSLFLGNVSNANETIPSFSTESAFHDEPPIFSTPKPKIIENIEIKQDNNDDIIVDKKTDNSNHSDEGITISNVDEDGSQVLFVQKQKFDDLGWQKSIQAIDVNYEEIAQFMNKGFSVDKPVFDNGNNMLLLSAIQQREGLLSFAISNGANLNYVNKNGQSLLYFASSGMDKNIFQTVLEKLKNSPLINKSDNSGKTPLHMASYSSNLNNVSLLIKNNAEINAKDKDGRTPLFYALVAGKYDIATLLIKNGAILNLIDNNGTSIEELLLHSNTDMFELSYQYLDKPIQNKIMTTLKDAPQISYKLLNPNISYEKFKDMEQFGISPNEDIIS